MLNPLTSDTANQQQRVTSATVRSAQRAKIGRKIEAAPETWAQRQERVNAERAARRAQREQTAS
ncbi:hypothetical protein [Streptomyces cavernae]|uniref:hypothetical protein n=1 Tax=Streptomyces cavernae TaxID=2259034 RepID=UPI000FEC0BF1|nr:hypothetical protein [Streptomyces cavernae]